MFIYSIRASTIKFFMVIILSLAILAGIFVVNEFAADTSTAADAIDFSGIKTESDRIKFISQFIPEISGDEVERVEFSIPENFDRVLRSYNEIQKAQGLDVTKYKNKKVVRYTYELPSYEDYKGTVYVNLILYRNTVIACDVSSADPDGFVKPLVKLG